VTTNAIGDARTVLIAPDLGAWLLLRRIQRGGVTVDMRTGTIYHHGRLLLPMLGPHMYGLADHGYVRLESASLRLTNAGELLLHLLIDVRWCWLIRQRAGLPRCRVDLDRLAPQLSELAGRPSFRCDRP
jgi:hypothetical protein